MADKKTIRFPEIGPEYWVDNGDGSFSQKTVSNSSNTTGTKSAPASVSVSTSAIQLVAAGTRKAVMFSNNGANAVYIGKDSSVTSSNGVQIASGGSFVDTLTSDAWYAIAGSGTNAVAVVTVS